ncbi:hypothetical protein MJT46_018862 [Ovis ammon polii x Ovis aries]|nr:hypothetical protein MJT46_018862 [Ovis ammon polii x Ovis aries]
MSSHLLCTWMAPSPPKKYLSHSIHQDAVRDALILILNCKSLVPFSATWSPVFPRTSDAKETVPTVQQMYLVKYQSKLETYICVTLNLEFFHHNEEESAPFRNALDSSLMSQDGQGLSPVTVSSAQRTMDTELLQEEEGPVSTEPPSSFTASTSANSRVPGCSLPQVSYLWDKPLPEHQQPWHLDFPGGPMDAQLILRGRPGKPEASGAVENTTNADKSVSAMPGNLNLKQKTNMDHSYPNSIIADSACCHTPQNHYSVEQKHTINNGSKFLQGRRQFLVSEPNI